MTGPDGSRHAGEIAAGERFPFGANWGRFLALLSEDRIEAACRSLRELLGVESLAGRSVLDAGSGSGLFSLCAMRLGAAGVCAFDYDPRSVACAEELKARYFPGDPRWTVLSGSVLDGTFLGSLGRFDIVYSWGVLHHTGDLWAALGNVSSLVAPGGTLAVAIYNDQGWRSKAWRAVKTLYCRTPPALRGPLFFPLIAAGEASRAVLRLCRGQSPFRSWRTPGPRGMSPYHDWIDWLGGYPFEVASPAAVSAFLRDRGFALERLADSRGKWGNNEYVFRRR